MPRLLIVVNHAGYFLSHRLVVATAALKAGFDVHVATPPSKHVCRIEESGLTWHTLPRMTRAGLNPLREAYSIFDVVRLYKKLQPDLVHHVTSKPVLYGTIAARLTGVRGVVNAFAGLGHVFIGNSARAKVIRQLLALAYRVSLRHPRMQTIFQNDDDRMLFVMNRWLRKEDTLLIRGSGVDLSLFTPILTHAAESPVVVLTARMLRTKGVIEFVDAARVLKAEGSTAKFVLVGEPDPDNPASLELDQLRAWSREGVIDYLGRRDDIPAVLASANIVCLPSHREGLPKSLLEGASSGLPLIATDVPGCREVVRNGLNGFLVPVGDVRGLTDALRTLIQSESLRKEFGRNSRKIAEAEFSVEKVVAETLAAYAGVLKS